MTSPNLLTLAKKATLTGVLSLSVGLLAANTGLSSSLVLHVGPVALGGGGPNPISIPPASPVEYEIQYVTQKNHEFSLGLSPGLILYGVRSEHKVGTYISAGGGVILNQAGIRLGVYSAFGYNAFCGTFCFNMEYKQALGFIGGSLISPYAIRVGASWLF